MRRYTVVVGDRTFTIDVEETAADRFEVSVDGRTFEAVLEAQQDLPGADITPEMVPADEPRAGPPAAVAGTAPLQPGPPRSAPPAPPVHPPGPTAPPGRADVLTAPMPGVVLELRVKPGDVLGRGDPILVLEAMKMRNTIRSPRPAVVLEVAVEAGQPVGPGEPLVRLGQLPG